MSKILAQMHTGLKLKSKSGPRIHTLHQHFPNLTHSHTIYPTLSANHLASLALSFFFFLLSQILFNEDLSSNQVRYFTTIRMIITNKRITATKAMMAFILHLRHHICLRSCLDLLLKAVALSDNRGSEHRGWREGLNDITGFFYLICPVVHLVSPLFLLPL